MSYLIDEHIVPARPGADKALSYEAAKVSAKRWCLHHAIPAPTFFDAMPPARHKDNRGCYDFYEESIYVNVRRLPTPISGKPVRRWSFTGYKADITAPGVLFHELGHHVHFWLMGQEPRGAHKLMDALRAIQAAEAPVSGYEPNEWEVWTEAFRLYLLNPDLLGQGRPLRYALLAEYGLEPGHALSWEQVLQHAHPAFHAAAKNWIAKRPSRKISAQLGLEGI